jgi:hypothetical protein
MRTERPAFPAFPNHDDRKFIEDSMMRLADQKMNKLALMRAPEELQALIYYATPSGMRLTGSVVFASPKET